MPAGRSRPRDYQYRLDDLFYVVEPLIGRRLTYPSAYRKGRRFCRARQQATEIQSVVDHVSTRSLSSATAALGTKHAQRLWRRFHDAPCAKARRVINVDGSGHARGSSGETPASGTCSPSRAASLPGARVQKLGIGQSQKAHRRRRQSRLPLSWSHCGPVGVSPPVADGPQFHQVDRATEGRPSVRTCAENSLVADVARTRPLCMAPSNIY